MAGPRDLALVDRVRRAAREADGQDPLDEAADLHLRHHDPDDLVLLTVDGDDGSAGGAVGGGFALVRGAELDLVVAPADRRRGLGASLLARARALATAGAPALAWSHGGHPGAAALAARAGWRRTRDLWVMRRPASLPLPALVPAAGVVVRGLDPDRESDLAGVLAVNAAAFADHPEQGELDRAGLGERMAEDWFDPAGLLLGVDERTGEVLGFHWTKQHDAATGEVYVVGIGPDAQGRGLGRLLTLAGLHHLDRAGVEEVILYVEADNAAAVHVYSGLGFTHADVDTHVQYAAP